MTIYFVSVAAILLYGVACFYGGDSDKRKKIYLSLSFTHLGLVMGLRSVVVGTDALAYSRLFHSIGQSNSFFGGDYTHHPVYSAYNKILYLLIPHERFLMLCTALIICFGVAYFIYNYSENVVISTYAYITLYFYLTSFNPSRQYIAISLLLIAICFQKKKRYVLMSIMALLAIGVHNTAILFIPVLFFTERNVSIRKIAVIFVAGALFILLHNLFFELVAYWFADIFTWYQRYLDAAIYQSGRGRNILLVIFYACVVFLAIGVLLSKKAATFDEERKGKLLYLLVPCMIAVTLGFALYDSIVIGRLREYYSIFFICLIPNTVELIGKEKHILYLFLLVILLIPFMVQLFSNLDGVVPYIPFWRS